jgi:SPP1 family predicted phage head-tail adaptor
MSRASIGAMRHRLIIESPVDGADSAGEPTRVYTASGEAWGLIEPLRGVTAFEGDRPESVVTHRVHMRWRADIIAGVRLRSSDRLMQVRSVLNPDVSGVELICLCEEIA